jgi:hypothetical protein
MYPGNQISGRQEIAIGKAASRLMHLIVPIHLKGTLGGKLSHLIISLIATLRRKRQLYYIPMHEVPGKSWAGAHHSVRRIQDC